MGENGSGKSTLIEAIAVSLGFGPEGGTKNVQFATTDDRSPLFAYLKMVRSFARPKDHYFLRAESFSVSDRKTIYTHPGTGAVTHLLTIERKDRIEPVVLERALAMAVDRDAELVINTRSGPSWVSTALSMRVVTSGPA